MRRYIYVFKKEKFKEKMLKRYNIHILVSIEGTSTFNGYLIPILLYIYILYIYIYIYIYIVSGYFIDASILK